MSKLALRWVGLGLTLAMLLGLAACAAKGNQHLALGMSRDRVIQFMGAPRLYLGRGRPAG